MKGTVIYLFLVLSSVCFSQPIIDSANFAPKLWETFTRERDKFTNVDYWSTGFGYTWNFGPAPYAGVDTLIYDSVDATNCQATNPIFAGRKFTHALISFGSYRQNIGCPSYFKIFKNDGYYEAGAGDSQSLNDYYYKQIPFPLTTSTNYSTTVWGTNYGYAFPTYTVTYSRNLYIIADGYGSLTLPNGATYSNCLRIRQHTVDSTSSTPYMDTIYYWLAPGVHYPVLEVQANTPWRNAYYITSSWSVAGIKSNKKNNSITLSPNPANDKIILTLPADEANPFSVRNTFGELCELNSRRISANEIEIDVSKLSEGVYFLLLGSSREIVTRKFIITR